MYTHTYTHVMKLVERVLSHIGVQSIDSHSTNPGQI